MVRNHVFDFASSLRRSNRTQPGTLARTMDVMLGRLSRFWCGLHGHLVLMHYEPDRLSLECALCGYKSEGWEVGRPMTARRHANNLQARPDRRRTLRALPSNARLAS